MKTLSLQVEDHLYEALVTLLQQFPQDKVRWLILGFEDTAPPEPKNRTRKAGLMMEDPKKHIKSMRVR